MNERYARHYSLNDFGPQAQQKLLSSKIIVIGAGGLGCPVLQYLTAAGVGTIGVADPDVVSLSNLQRQVLFSTQDIGKPKAETAAARLKALNPEIEITPMPFAITTANAFSVFKEYNVVIDCTDNFAARYLINDACVLLNKPLIFGAIYQYEGQVAVFNVEENGSKTNYRHLFPSPPDPMEVADCNETGVLGVLPGLIGIIQATEAIKLITCTGKVLTNKLLTFNLLSYQQFIMDIVPAEDGIEMVPENEAAFKATHYEWLCGMKKPDVENLMPKDFLSMIYFPETLVIDVREAGELPEADFKNINVPLSVLQKNIPEIEENNLIVFCQSGKRSLKAAALFQDKYGKTKKISHLQGGIIALSTWRK